MKKLKVRTPILGAEIPGRINSIIEHLFPEESVHIQEGISVTLEEDSHYIPITTTEVLEEIARLPHGRAPGPNGIANELIKTVIRSDPDYVTRLFNRCITEKYHPDEWKVADLVLLHKPGRPAEDPSSFRPLCLLNTVGKLFEKIISRRLNRFLEDTGAISEKQYGSRRNRPAIGALKKLQEIVATANGGGLVVGMIALDVRNAFNSAPWNGILNSLRAMAVLDYLVSILSKYFFDRKVRYRNRGATIEFDVNRGVPQGSVLGPTLWNALYNRLLMLPLPSNVQLIPFADDVAIIATVEHGNFLNESLKPAFNQVSKWMAENGLTFAAHKTEAIVFTNRWSRN